MKTRICIFATSFALIGCQVSKRPDYSGIILPSPKSGIQGSILYSDASANPKVRNGQAYEMVRLQLPAEIRHVTLPSGTKVVVSQNDECVVYLKKSLHWMGHPDAPVSIETSRKAMGAGVRIRGDRLEIALFGAWSSIEGGSQVLAAVSLPKGIAVRESKALDFADSGKKKGSQIYDSGDWFTLPTVLDPNRGYSRLTND